VDAYRGAGRPEATFSIERVIDKCAHELGLDAMERTSTRLSTMIHAGHIAEVRFLE